MDCAGANGKKSKRMKMGEDFMGAFLSTDIEWNKLNNPALLTCLAEGHGVKLPSWSSPRHHLQKTLSILVKVSFSIG